jgi:hypothetical protein
MTAPRFAGLGARAAKAAATPEPDPVDPADPADDGDEDDLEITDKKKDKPMAETPVETTADTVAATDGTARMKAVFAHESVKGNEARAAALLADNDFDALSAEAIVKIIAGDTAPKPEANDDSAVGKEMLAKMDVVTGDLGADGGEAKPDAAAPMKSAFAKINKTSGLAA